MKSKITARKGTVFTCDTLPYNLQAGDTVQFLDSSGKPRGEGCQKYHPPLWLVLVNVIFFGLLCLSLGILLGSVLRCH